MLKKTLLAFMSLLLLFSTYMPSKSQNNKAEALSYYSCDLLLESFNRTREYIRNSLVPGYYQSMHYADIYPSYEEKFLDLADRGLGHILSYTLSIIQDLKDLPGCNGFEDIDEAEKINLIKSVLNLLLDPTLESAFLDEKDYDSYSFIYTKKNYYNLFYSYIYNTYILEAEMKIDNLLDKVIPKDVQTESKIYTVLTSVMDHTANTFIDLAFIREKSFTETDDLSVKLVLMLDRANLLMNDAKTIKDSAISKPNFTLKDNPFSDVLKGKAKEALIRGSLTEFIDYAIQGQIPGPRQPFLTDFSSNLAALATAGNRLGVALVFAELNADLWDHVNSSLKPVFDNANVTLDQFNKNLDNDTYHDIAFKHEAMKTANNIMSAKINPSYNDDTFTLYFVEQIIKLEEEAKKIYNLNPNEIKIYLDDQRLMSTVTPFIQNGTTMVPLRLISEALDVTPKWNSELQTITFTTTRAKNYKNKEVDIVLTVGSKTAKIHTRNVNLDTAPVIKNGTTFVPLRFIAEALSLDVKWIAEGNNVVLNSK